MSKVQVDTIDTRSGTSTMQIGSTNTSTINIGVSGDTVNIPSGVTIANAGTATGFGETNEPYFSAKGSGTQTASTATNTTCAFNTLVDSLDSASGFNTSTYKYTVQSSGAGLWYLRAGFYFSGASSFGSGEQVQIQLQKNDSDFMNATVFYGGQTDGWVFCDSLGKLAVNDTLRVRAYQNTGGDITLYLNNYHNSIFAGFRVKSL